MNYFFKSLKIITLLFLFPISLLQAETLKIGTAGVLPLFTELNEKGVLTGFEIDLGEAVCREMNVECEFINIPDIAQLLPALNEKKVDFVMSSLHITDYRSELANPGRIYMSSSGRFLKLKSNNLEFVAGGLKNKKIGVVLNSLFYDYVKANYASDLSIKTYKNSDESVKGLLAGEVDFIMDNITVLEHYNQKYESTTELLGPAIDDPKWFKGKSAYFRKTDDHLREKFNAAVIKLRTTREFQKISQKYFHKDLYSGY